MLRHIAILTPVFVSLFWTIFFFLNRKKNSRSQNIWMRVMALVAVTTVVIAFYWYCGEQYELFCWLDALECGTTLAYIPVMFLYFRELTGDDRALSLRKRLVLFLPPLLLSGICFLEYLFLGTEYAAAYMASMLEGQGPAPGVPEGYYLLWEAISYAYSAVFLVQAVAVLAYAIRRLYLYRSRLEEFFSDVEGEKLKHHWAVLRGLLVLLTVSAGLSLSGYMMYIGYTVWVPVIAVFYGANLYYICYHVYCSSDSSEDISRELSLSGREASGQEDGADESGEPGQVVSLREKILPNLNRVMAEEKVFLKSDLRLGDVAQLLQTNRTYLSRLIHEEFNCNFAEYVNSMRIGYAQELFRENSNYTQEYIASVSGFIHPSTFSRIFKKQTGLTFREWQKQG